MVIQGDALTELRGLANKSVKLCVTSPPHFGVNDYGGTLGRELTVHAYIANLMAIAQHIQRVLTDDGRLMWIMGGYPLIPMGFALSMCADGWNLEACHICNKTNENCYDFAFIFNKGETIAPSSVIEFEQKIDPDTKWGYPPYKLVEAFIQDYSEPQDTVLDPFAGSGSVGKIAKRLSRNYILIEIMKDYIPIIEKRLDIAGKPQEELLSKSK